MIGETIVALASVIALLIWVLIMVVVDQSRRISRLETMIAHIYGHGPADDPNEVAA